MSQMVTVIVIAVWLFSSCNALFFGLFNSQQTPKPDLVISEQKVADTDRTAYEQYSRSIEPIYPLYTQVRYVPFYVYQPQYSKYVPTYSTEILYHQPNSIYHTSTVQNDHHNADTFQEDYSQEPNVHIQRPIVVLPFKTFQQTFESETENTQAIDNLITPPTSNNIISNSKVVEYAVPKPQIPTTLYDLPTLNIGPDFRTGGYLTKPLTTKTVENNKRSG